MKIKINYRIPIQIKMMYLKILIQRFKKQLKVTIKILKVLKTNQNQTMKETF